MLTNAAIAITLAVVVIAAIEFLVGAIVRHDLRNNRKEGTP